MDHWSALFSLPQPGTDERVYDTVADVHGRAIAEWLIAAHGEEIVRASDGLVEYVSSFTQSSATLDTVWSPAFGRAQCLLKGHVLDPTEVAARLALHLADAGTTGAWSATMPPDTLLLGSLVLPSTVELDVEVDGTTRTVRVLNSDGERRTARYEPSTGRWRGDGVEELGSMGARRPVLLLSDHALPITGRQAQRFLGEGTTPVVDITDDMVGAFSDGLHRVQRLAPEYARWIERVLRGVVVCPVEVGFRVVSGSGEDAPGIIHASYPVSAMEIAEMLVHECTHQYFYMLQRVGDLDDGNDEQLYWSPPIRMNRPLSRILMAYHALGNIRLFYDRARAGGRDDELQYVDANEPAINDALAELDSPLRNNQALTEFGRGLYEPLADRLAAAV